MKELNDQQISGILSSPSDALFINCILPDGYIMMLKGTNQNILLKNVDAKNLIILNSSGNDLQIINSIKLRFLSIKNCEFKTISIINSIIHDTLKFEDCKIGRFLMSESFLYNHWLAFIKCRVYNLLDLYNTHLDRGIDLKECEEINRLRLDGFTSNSNGISISRSTIETNVFCVGNSKMDRILLYKCKFRDKFSCKETFVKKRLSIIECDFDSSFEFKCNLSNENVIVDDLHIETSSFKDGCEFFGNSKSVINALTIKCSSSLQGTISFTELIVKNTLFLGSLTNANIIYRNIIFQNISFENFENLSEIRFRNIIPIGDSKFSVVDTDLNKTYFNDIDFQAIKNVLIYNSTLRNIEYSDISWPIDIKVSKSNYVIPEKIKYKRQNNLYRQLKQAAKKNDHRLDEMLFQSREWHFIQKYGQEEQKNKIWRFNDAFILFFNKSNSFGTNWVKPLILLLLINFILYILLLIVLDPTIKLCCFSCDFAFNNLFGLIGQHFWMFLNIINPAHNLKHFEQILLNQELNPIISNWKAMVIDVLLRLSSGYFIYQMIVAFRKFSKN